MVKVICKECGKEYGLSDGENVSDFTCECGGTLEERRSISDVRTANKSETKPEDTGIKETKYCSNCAEEIDYKAEICPKCGVRQPIDQITKKQPESKETKFCSNCGSEIDVKAEICPKCGVRQAGYTTQVKEKKNPLLAAILSFLIVGLGQLYNGQIEKFIFLIIGAFVIGAIGILTFGLGFILTPFLWIFAMYDAYITAQKLNAGEPIKKFWWD